MWGQASVSAALARFWHLTRSRLLADAASAKPRGQARFTHSLSIQSAGQADVSEYKNTGCSADILHQMNDGPMSGTLALALLSV